MNRTSIVAGWLLYLTTLSVRSDSTIVEKSEGYGHSQEFKIFWKDALVRVKDPSGPNTTIIDINNQDTITLMPASNGEKRFIRIPGRVLKTISMVQLPKLQSTGKKESINGFDTEEYVRETAEFKAVFSLATTYPDNALFVKALDGADFGMFLPTKKAWPDYHDLPGLPVRIKMILRNGDVFQTTIISITRDALPPSDFQPPPDYREIKMPDFGKSPTPTPTPH
jgi:hypothetical protein